ncbi:MAG: hypothetical protein KDA37_12245 [Planctomycetales bacterium]|nr:hypothetical protein [Planctomycetales bacterium]
MKVDTHSNLLVQAATSLVRRRRVLLAALMLVGIAFVANALWHSVREPLLNDARYLVTTENLDLGTQPPWVTSDIRPAALARAGLQGPLSTLEPQQLTARLAESLRLHPWVKGVTRIELRSPNLVVVELQWRRPVAVVESNSPSGASLLPIDNEGVRLPVEQNLSEQLRYLPRITQMSHAPQVGEVWQDLRVVGALRLIESFAEDWQRLSLLDIAAEPTPQIRGEQQFYSYELLARGGTRIVWGAAPNAAAPDEATIEQKLARLKAFLATSGADLNTDRSPQWIDVRYDLRTKQRLAKKKTTERTALKADPESQEKAK